MQEGGFMPSNKELPLLIIGIDQGIPSRFDNFNFKIHENLKKIKSTETIKPDTEFVITFSTKENMSLDLTDFEKEISYTGPIGVKCKCKSIQSDQETELYTVESEFIEYVYIREISCTLNKMYALVEEAKVNEDVDPTTLKEIISFVIFIGKKTKILKKEDLTLFKKTKEVLDLCDAVVHYYYDDYFDKYVYMQLIDLSEKIKNVINFILETSNIDLGNYKDFTVGKITDSLNFNATSEKKPNKKYPEEVKKALQKEAKRLTRTPPSSLEAQSMQNYIETLQDIPWDNYTKYDHTIKEVLTRIDETHYGLNDVKKHIFEHIVLEDHLGESKGSVLCFIGPPGTGKTSIAKSIAKATEREVIKIALGGVSDEAEIRGHRRTYVASKPGRIVDGLIKSQQMNPIIVLDEVDKLDKGTRGDPTSALLELLDPEQNNEFIDRFVEIPIDLSKALFICTANYIESIPEALKDRFEFIHFEHYEQNEREQILINYIYPKVLKEYHMDQFKINVLDSFYKTLSEEVSLREIEKKVRKILKAVLVEFVINEKENILLDSNFSIYLNKSKPKKQIGFSNGNKNNSKQFSSL
jgi:ATP-dependent Lon protease